MTGKFTAAEPNQHDSRLRPKHPLSKMSSMSNVCDHDYLTDLNNELGMINGDPDALVFLNDLNKDKEKNSCAVSSENCVDSSRSSTNPILSQQEKQSYCRKKDSKESILDNASTDLLKHNEKTSPPSDFDHRISSDLVIHRHDGSNGKRSSSPDPSIGSQSASASIFPSPIKPRYILLPHSDFRSAWDFYMSIVLIYVAIFVPYRVSFLTDLNGFLKYLDIFIDCSFGLDIILNFVTAYDIPEIEKYEFRMKKIALRYLKGFFVIDFVATFPFDLILAARSSSEIDGFNQASKLTKLPKIIKFLRVARLLKLLRVHRLQQIVRYVELNYNIHQGVSRLVNIVGTIMVATHLVGCLWHAIGVDLDVEKSLGNCPNYEDFFNSSLIDDEAGWVCREGLIASSDGHKYASSVYWAFSTLTTVGYGDISARTVGEQCFSMIMMLLGVSWYAYVVGSMSTIISSFDRQNKLIRLKMIQVNTFIQESKIPLELGMRIRKYFEYSLARKSNGLFGYDADNILNELSSTLRIDVVTHVERKLIKRIPFFDGKSSTFVASAIQLFQPVVVHGGDYIIKEGSAADEMYFLVKGKAVVYYGNKKVKEMEEGWYSKKNSLHVKKIHVLFLSIFNEGSYFGEIGCILGGIRRASIMAETTCELQCLSKRNLNILLGQHPEIGKDLKKVATDRMSQVKAKNPCAKRDSQHDEPRKNTSGKNLESFSKQKDTRKLSLTSGFLKGGSHKKGNEELIAKLNSEDHCNFDTGDEDIKRIIKEILVSLDDVERHYIELYIANEVSGMVKDKVKEIGDAIIQKNRLLLNDLNRGNKRPRENEI